MKIIKNMINFIKSLFQIVFFSLLLYLIVSFIGGIIFK
jgi:hypothetical protein